MSSIIVAESREGSRGKLQGCPCPGPRRRLGERAVGGALLPLGKNELPAASSFSEELVSEEQASWAAHVRVAAD